MINEISSKADVQDVKIHYCKHVVGQSQIGILATVSISRIYACACRASFITWRQCLATNI